MNAGFFFETRAASSLTGGASALLGLLHRAKERTVVGRAARDLSQFGLKHGFLRFSRNYYLTVLLQSVSLNLTPTTEHKAPHAADTYTRVQHERMSLRIHDDSARIVNLFHLTRYSLTVTLRSYTFRLR